MVFLGGYYSAYKAREDCTINIEYPKSEAFTRYEIRRNYKEGESFEVLRCYPSAGEFRARYTFNRTCNREITVIIYSTKNLINQKKISELQSELETINKRKAAFQADYDKSLLVKGGLDSEVLKQVDYEEKQLGQQHSHEKRLAELKGFSDALAKEVGVIENEIRITVEKIENNLTRYELMRKMDGIIIRDETFKDLFKEVEKFYSWKREIVAREEATAQQMLGGVGSPLAFARAVRVAAEIKDAAPKDKPVSISLRG